MGVRFVTAYWLPQRLHQDLIVLMETSRKRSSRHLGQKTLRSHHVLPVSCIEIPASVLPTSTSVSGLIVADNFCPQVMPVGDPARGCGCGTAVAAAPLRVLLLPPAAISPCDTSPSRPQDMIQRLLLLLVQPGTDEKNARGIVSTEAQEDSLAQTSVLPLARQARLARELLAVGYQIAGVWLRIDQGEDTFENCVIRVLHHHVRHQQHSLISSMTSAVVKANAWTPQILLASQKKLAGLCCCFVFFSSRAPSEVMTNAEGAPTAMGYYCSGSSVASLVVRRLPVVVRQAEHPQHAIPLMRSIVYSTLFPLQMQLRFVPSKPFMCYVQAYGKQLSAALASQLYVNFAAMLCPPILASFVIAEPLPAPSSSQTAQPSSAPAACGKCAGSSPFKTEACIESMASLHEEADVHRICKTPKQVAGKPCYLLGNSACPRHCGSTWTPPSKGGDQHISSHFFVNSSGEVARYCGSTVLSGLSENAWDGSNGEKTACSSRSSLCFLQPLLVGDLVSRYEISLDITREPSHHQCETDLPVPVRVQFRVVPCDDTRGGTAVSDSFTVQEPEDFASGLSSLRSPVILSVKGEFVAAVVASVDASVEHLRKSLAADAAAAVAGRVADRVADVCAANFHSEWQPQRPDLHNRRSYEQPEQQSVSGSVAPLDVRRFYMVNMDRAVHGGKQTYDDSACTLLVSDFSGPEDTPDDAAAAAVERLEFLLGVPTAAVAPHSLLKDGGAAVVLHVNDMRSHRVEPHELGSWHKQSEFVTRLQQSSALATFEVRSRQAAVFWNDLEERASTEMTKQSKAHGGETSAHRGPRSVLLWASLVLLVIIVATYMLFPTTASIDQRYNP